MSDEKDSGVEELLGVEKGVDEQITSYVRKASVVVSEEGSHLPIEAMFICAVWQNEKGYISAPVLASRTETARLALARALRQLADGIEKGERGRDHIPTIAGKA